MAIYEMQDKLAIMPQADVIITVNGAVFTVPATTPFTTSAATIDIPGGTILAVMYNAQNQGSRMLQVFSIDAIETVT